MAEYEIKYVNLGTNGSRSEHITEVGGIGTTGWRLSVASVIANILQGHHFFTTDRRGAKAYVKPWPQAQGPYIRSIPDGSTQDNLLSLPPIPAHFTVPS